MAYPFASRLAAWCAEDGSFNRDLTRGRSRESRNSEPRIAEDLGLQFRAIGPVDFARRLSRPIGFSPTGPVEAWSRSKARFA